MKDFFIPDTAVGLSGITRTRGRLKFNHSAPAGTLDSWKDLT